MPNPAAALEFRSTSVFVPAGVPSGKRSGLLARWLQPRLAPRTALVDSAIHETTHGWRHEMVMLTSETAREINFERLGISIELKRRSDDSTQIRVEAPTGFLDQDFDPTHWKPASSEPLSQAGRSEFRHHIRNRLHVAGMTLDILCRRSGGSDGDIEPILDMAIESLTELDELAVKKGANESSRQDNVRRTNPDNHSQ
jgi:hypothetical protein